MLLHYCGLLKGYFIIYKIARRCIVRLMISSDKTESAGALFGMSLSDKKIKPRFGEHGSYRYSKRRLTLWKIHFSLASVL
jgi:hypothetical protein